MPRFAVRKRFRGFSRAEIEEALLELLEEAVRQAIELAYEPLFEGDRPQVDFDNVFKEISGLMAYYICYRYNKNGATEIVDRGGSFAQGCVMVGWSSVSRRE